MTKGNVPAVNELGRFEDLFDQMLTEKLKHRLEDIFDEVVSSKLEKAMSELLSRMTSTAAKEARIVAPKQLTPKEASIYIGMSLSYLCASRSVGAIEGRTPGPPWIKIGKSVRYEITDLDKWIAQHRKKDKGSRDT